jgi:sulfopyruvate decarboxylase TPP-binding subunit
MTRPYVNPGEYRLVKARLILAELKKQRVTHVVGVPDNGSRALFEQLFADADIELILASREGEVFAIAAGLWLGGAHPAALIQNTGFLEAGDAFRGTVYNMAIPLVMLIGYRGYNTMQPGAPRVDTAATFFEPTLKAWDIPYTLLFDDKDVPQIPAAFAKVEETSMPAAVVLVEETT